MTHIPRGEGATAGRPSQEAESDPTPAGRVARQSMQVAPMFRAALMSEGAEGQSGEQASSKEAASEAHVVEEVQEGGVFQVSVEAGTQSSSWVQAWRSV